MHSLADIIRLSDQPKRAERYLRAIINTKQKDRLEANNLLGTMYLHQNRLVEAIHIFKQTVAMQPDSIEAIWAMKMLSLVYRRIGFKGERCNIDMQRLQMLRRLLLCSNDQSKVKFASSELKQEFDDRDILSTWGYNVDGSLSYLEEP